MLDRGQLTALFGRVWVLHAQQLDLVFKKEGLMLTADQYRLMHLLWTRNGAHQEYYARKLGRDRSSLSRMLQFLEKEGLLTRQDDAQDRARSLCTSHLLVSSCKCGLKLAPTKCCCKCGKALPAKSGSSSTSL